MHRPSKAKSVQSLRVHTTQERIQKREPYVLANTCYRLYLNFAPSRINVTKAEFEYTTKGNYVAVFWEIRRYAGKSRMYVGKAAQSKLVNYVSDNGGEESKLKFIVT